MNSIVTHSIVFRRPCRALLAAALGFTLGSERAAHASAPSVTLDLSAPAASLRGTANALAARQEKTAALLNIMYSGNDFSYLANMIRDNNDTPETFAEKTIGKGNADYALAVNYAATCLAIEAGLRPMMNGGADSYQVRDLETLAALIQKAGAQRHLLSAHRGDYTEARVELSAVGLDNTERLTEIFLMDMAGSGVTPEDFAADPDSAKMKIEENLAGIFKGEEGEIAKPYYHRISTLIEGERSEIETALEAGFQNAPPFGTNLLQTLRDIAATDREATRAVQALFPKPAPAAETAPAPAAP